MSTDTALALGLLALVGRALPDAAAGLPAHRVRGRRPGRAGGDRDRLQRADVQLVPLVAAVAAVRRHPAAARSRGCAAAALRPARRRCLGRRCWQAGVDPVVARAGDRAARATPTRPRAATCERATELFRLFREQPTPELARYGAGRAGLGAVAERAAAAALPPVDELRDRAAVRAGQRGHRDRRRLARRGALPRRSRSASWSATCVGKPVGDRRRRPGWSPG